MMDIYSVEFIYNSFPCALDNFKIYKDILQANNNKYKLKCITKSTNSIIFGKYDDEIPRQIKTITLDGIKINFSI